MTMRQAVSPDVVMWCALCNDAEEGLEAFMRERGWLPLEERVEGYEAAGQGNMNLTLRVHTSRRSVVLKHARPWVERYPQIAAPVGRMVQEIGFYERVREIPEVSERMPMLLGADRSSPAMLLEDIAEGADLTMLYSGGVVLGQFAVQLAEYLRALHDATSRSFEARFANRAMRRLNHEHIFCYPMESANGMDLDAIEPGLAAAAKRLREDAVYRKALSQTGERYLSDGDHLVHGDYFPGSWMCRTGQLYVVDPEFSYFGDREFDVGCAIAHFALCRQQPSTVALFLERYAPMRGPSTLDDRRVARYAAAEVMRRLIGVAQLPIPRTEGWRSALLERSRQAMRDSNWERLW